MIKGVSLGATLIQTNGTIGGFKNVFVKLQGVKNDLVFPTFGGMLKNPFKSGGKIYAGDLFEYRTNEDGVKPELYLLKTFEVVSASGTTVNLVNDGYHHVPCVGDVLMVAPATFATTGTAVTVSAVVADGDKYVVTLSATLGTLEAGAILVEAEAAGSGKKMLVQNPNAWAPCDYDLFYAPATGDADFDGARYMITPALHAIAYTKKMAALPACVKALNKSKVNGWFEL